MNAQEQAIVKALMQVMWADGTVDDGEREFLGGLLTRMGLDARELAEVGKMMISKPEMPDLEKAFPDAASRQGVMRILLEMAMADGHVAESEMHTINALARHLGVSGRELEELKGQD